MKSAWAGVLAIGLVASTSGGVAARDRGRAVQREPHVESGCRVMVHPTVAPAPATVRVDMLVEPSSDNRHLEIAIDSGEFYRSSRLELEGADAARLHTVEFRALPAGSYDIRVSVIGPSGSIRKTAHSNLQVTG